MAKVVCCVTDTQVVNNQILAILNVSIEGGTTFGTDMYLDFQRSIIQMNSDLRLRVSQLISTSYQIPTSASDVVLCGAFS